MPFLNDNNQQTTIGLSRVSINDYRHHHHFSVHKRAQSVHRNIRGGSLRPRTFTGSKTQRSASIRRDSFGHNKQGQLGIGNNILQ